MHRVDHRRSTVPATGRPPCSHTVRAPSRPTDLTTVFDRRSVGLLWRMRIVETVILERSSRPSRTGAERKAGELLAQLERDKPKRYSRLENLFQNQNTAPS
jgi:hypothetical protein